MKLSAKSRYALASVIKMAMAYDSKETMTILEIATDLNISKIYLERVFSQLKQGNVVSAIKGAQGGYYLTKTPAELSVYDVLASVEPGIFAENEKTVEAIAPKIEKTLQNKVYVPLDNTLQTTLSAISLADLAEDALKDDSNYMYYL